MSRHPRFRRRTRVAVAALATAALLAACTDGDEGHEGALLPGITDSAVKVGYVIVDTEELNDMLGLNVADYGSRDVMAKGIQAVVDWVNANGGAGGRQIDAQIVSFLGQDSSPETVQSVCADLTQDRQVFAAVLNGMYQDNTLPCFYNANTLVLDQTVVAHDQTQFEQYKNYVWSPTQPEYGAFTLANLDLLHANGFFEGTTKVQLLTASDEASRRVSKQIAEPWLQDKGLTSFRVDYVDSTNTGTLGATSKVALQNAKADGVNRVVTIGGARILPVVLADAEAVDFDARFSMSTVDNPIFIEQNPSTIVTERRVGMIGLGFNPTADVATDKQPPFPDPTNPAQQECVSIITAAGGTPPGGPAGEVVRENWRMVLAYCDATMMLKKALDAVGGGSEVTAQDFADGVASLGDTFRSSSTFGAQWGPNVYAGTNAGRAVVWDEACLCFDYSGDVVTWQAQAAVDTVAPSVPPATTDPTTDPAATDPTAAADPAAPTTPAPATTP